MKRGRDESGSADPVEKAAWRDKGSGLYLPTMVGSSLSGMLARIPCHPIDTIKTRLQTSGVDLRTLLRESSIRSLYRGFPVAFFGSAPGALLYFSSYEVARDSLGGGSSQSGLLSSSPFVAQLSAGMIAESVACAIFTPVDVLKERLQGQTKDRTTSPRLYYTSTMDGVRKIVRHEGWLGLYRGYGATVLSFGPFSALYFAFYETLKKSVGFQTDGQIAFLPSLFCAASAGAAASVLTNPLDLAKLRLQVQRGAAQATYGYAGFGNAVYRIATEEGLRGLFRGAATRVAFHAPTTAIAMSAFETCKTLAEEAMF